MHEIGFVKELTYTIMTAKKPKDRLPAGRRPWDTVVGHRSSVKT